MGYGVALVSRIDKMICFFCKRDLYKRPYSAKETCNFIDPTDRSHPIADLCRMAYLCRSYRRLFGHFCRPSNYRRLLTSNYRRLFGHLCPKRRLQFCFRPI